jgi:hypothetical protein
MRASRRVFEVFRAHLARRGLLPKEGVIVDASFVEIPRQRNPRAENALVKEGKNPPEWSCGSRSNHTQSRHTPPLHFIHLRTAGGFWKRPLIGTHQLDMHLQGSFLIRRSLNWTIMGGPT